MVGDQFKGIDELNTSAKYGAPNFRKAHGGYPVYGMGQPTSEGLKKVMDFLENEKYSVSMKIKYTHFKFAYRVEILCVHALPLQVHSNSVTFDIWSILFCLVSSWCLVRKKEKEEG